MKIEVSIGEAIDKLSILELKITKINNEDKIKEIQKEINALHNCYIYKQDFSFLYKLLIYVNETIWDMTDKIKTIKITDNQFSYISNQIFEFNQKRFRIKNWFNLITSSNIKEQKSYSSIQCKICINDINIFYEKIPEIYFLALEHDIITIISKFNDKIKQKINIPIINYENDNNDNNDNNIILENFHIDSSIKSIFTATQ
jgi:hypothetical protein